MKTKIYQQCLLRKGKITRVSWLPVKYAKKNKYLKLRNSYDRGCLRLDSEWEDGWQVLDVYDTKITEDKLNLVKDQCYTTRDTSDV